MEREQGAVVCARCRLADRPWTRVRGLLGRRRLPDQIAGPVALLAPVLLAALVVTQTVGGDNQLVLDARLAGVGAGAAAIAAGAPLPAVVVVAAAATAVTRLLT